MAATEAAGFGKNKVQYEYRHWKYIQSEHFDIYFYGDGYDQAVFTAAVADSAYGVLTQDYDWELPQGERIVIVTYQNHNDFGNTNLTFGLVPEGTGGFTEFFKNRVVIPFEGSWEDYRHVIHHELNHAFQLSMFYGESVLTGAIRFPLPLWFAEGSSEYVSRNGWDREANMYMADAVTAGYLPEIPYLRGFLNYKGGQSIFCFIEDEFGREKIAELMHKVRSMRNIERAFESTLGMDVEDLSKEWKTYLKRIYWPVIQDRRLANEMADRITDHLELENFVNNSPAISPSGDRIVYLSDRTGYFDLYSLHIREPDKHRRILQGQQSGSFEELHWLRPGIGWAPDEQRIVFASKAAERDALFIIDAERGKVLEKYEYDLLGVFSPAWSPDGRRIAFVALQAGHSDIWLQDLETGEIRRLTDDRYSDFDPSFSTDGRYLLFTSDRGDDLSRDSMFHISGRDYYDNDIYLADLESSGILRLTDLPYDVRTPIWTGAPDPKRGAAYSGSSPGALRSAAVLKERPAGTGAGEIFFVCDAGGAYNLYSLPARPYVEALAAGSVAVDSPPRPERRSNVLTGVFQPSVSRGGKLLFTSFENGGYDIFLHKNLHLLERLGPIPDDDRDLLPFNRIREVALEPDSVIRIHEEQEAGLEWRRYDFTRLAEERREREEDPGPDGAEAGGTRLKAGVAVPGAESARFDEEGNYLAHDYRLRFSPDMAVAQAQYSDLFGFQGVSQVMFSDLMGNHRIFAYLNLYNRIEFSNIHLYYQFLARRVNYEGGVFRYVRYLSGEVINRYYRDNLYGGELNASYPVNRFLRLSLENRWATIARDSLNSLNYEEDSYGAAVYHDYIKGHFLTSALSLTFDNALWGGTGPVNGLRGRLTYTRGFPVAGNRDVGNDFHSLETDFRRYLRLDNDLHFAFRLAAGASFGPTPQRFFLGGSPNWVNTKFFKAEQDSSDNLLRSDIDELYYSGFVQPLRGSAIYHREGDRYALGNGEFRFPLLRYLATGWPFNFSIINLRGALFMDLGTAWYGERGFDAFDEDGHLQDLLLGYGWGFRIDAGLILAKFDWAWSSRLDGDPDGPQFIFTLGTEL